ncbi:hypothetical protein MMC34_000131 [Xylographa carneopallida]|nr:hypothetical protein [Xylographa carneopallida]
MDSPTGEPPLNLIVRFPSSLPDLPLTVSSPSTTAALNLNLLIRPYLPPTLSASRLRLIHSGAVLPPTTPISKSLRLPTVPPPPPPTPKGKAPVYLPPVQTLYIHCSLSDALSSAELEAEATQAASLRKSPSPVSSTQDGSSSVSSSSSASTSTHSAPLGFDRLLSAGLTPTEIGALRSQFLTIQAHTHTPDTMPSAAEMRILEDRWIDNTSSAATGPLDGAGGFVDEEGGAGSLDDILWGNVIGFFWPVGAVVWGFREEGVWSKRRQIAVLTGLLVNVAFSVLKFVG